MNAVIRYKTLKFRVLVASLTVMLTAALAAVLVAYTPALAQSTVADTRHPRVIEVRPAEGATGVNPTSGEFSEGRKVVAFFSEDMKPSSAMWAIKLYKNGSDTQEDGTMGYNAAQRKVTLWPPNPLERGVTYKAVVSTRAKDLAGNRLDQNPNRVGLQPKVWYFTIEE